MLNSRHFTLDPRRNLHSNLVLRECDTIRCDTIRYDEMRFNTIRQLHLYNVFQVFISLFMIYRVQLNFSG